MLLPTVVVFDQDIRTSGNTKGGQRFEEGLELEVTHIGGIDHARISLTPGVSILEGKNATNRTSLLTALADVLGGSPASLKTTTDSGRIELEFGDRTFTREYRRENGSVTASGNQYTDHRKVIDLFVRVLEDNPVRRAVKYDQDLRDILLEPVDTGQIERELHRIARERETIDEKIETIEREQAKLPGLEEQLEDLEHERGEVVADIERIQTEIEQFEASEEEAEQAEDLLDELDKHREKIQSIQVDIERQDTELTRLREERRETEDVLESIDVPDAEIDRAESQLEALTNEKRTLDSRIADLQQIVRFNEEMTAGDDSGYFAISTDSSVTSDLDPEGKEVECWTCGSQINATEIRERLQELRDVVQEYREDRMEITAELSDLEDRLKELHREESKQTEAEEQLQRIIEEIDVREAKKEQLTDEREEVEENLGAIKSRVEETAELRDSDLVDAYRRLSEYEYERGRVERQETSIQEEIERIEHLARERDELEERREHLGEEMDELRQRIETLEGRAIEQFVEHMNNLLRVLDYENIAKVWIERLVGQGDEASEFELHIVRETPDGEGYEDTIDTLSESEREVIGLVVALSGYLAYEVYEDVPIMLLDSLEALDADRLEALIEYFNDHVPYLVAALLPEDAGAISAEFEFIRASELQQAE